MALALNFFSLLALSFFSFGSSWADEPSINNFHAVRPGLNRGAQPGLRMDVVGGRKTETDHMMLYSQAKTAYEQALAANRPDKAAKFAKDMESHLAIVKLDFDYLKSIGTTTIMNFRNRLPDELPAIIAEQQLAISSEYRFKFANFPMASIGNVLLMKSPRIYDATVSNALAFISSSLAHGEVVFGHCTHGQDRTGVVMGLERVYFEGWSVAEAYQEMLRFHHVWIEAVCTGYFLTRGLCKISMENGSNSKIKRVINRLISKRFDLTPEIEARVSDWDKYSRGRTK